MKNVFGVQNSNTKKELSKPIADNLLIQTLIVLLEIFDVGG